MYTESSALDGAGVDELFTHVAKTYSESIDDELLLIVVLGNDLLPVPEQELKIGINKRKIKNFLKCLDSLISSIVLLISAIIARKHETSPKIKDS